MTNNLSSEDLDAIVASIEPIDTAWLTRAQRHQLELTKPPESLGRLEEIANRMCAIQRTLSPGAANPSVYVFAADHGICAEKINPYPQSVTRQMVVNFLEGGAAINAIARSVGAKLQVVDMGLVLPVEPHPDLKLFRIQAGSSNFCLGPAMSRVDALRSISAGVECAADAIAAGSQLLAAGEMGIGNTTVASSVTAALTHLPARAVCGRGTSADDSHLAHKEAVVARALELHRANLHSPLAILECLGGFEIGAICGFCLGAAKQRCAVLVDGFIATAGAALAVAMAPATSGYLFASHLSAERGHAALLSFLGWRPLLNLDMRLGEGTGAALSIPIVRAAVDTFRSMATFSAAGVLNIADEAT